MLKVTVRRCGRRRGRLWCAGRVTSRVQDVSSRGEDASREGASREGRARVETREGASRARKQVCVHVRIDA